MSGTSGSRAPGSWRRATAMAGALALLWASPASAQGFGIQLERGEVGVDGRGVHHVSGISPGSVWTDYQQWLRLPASGYLIHPRVLNYNLALRPLFGQHRSSTTGQDESSRDLGFDAAFTAFRARRLTVTAQATRSSSLAVGELGSRSDARHEGFTSTLFIRDRYFPTTVAYSNRRMQSYFESAYTDLPIERDEASERLRAEVRNKKLTGVFERVDHRNLTGAGDYRALSGQVRHRAEWGKGSSLATGYNLYVREGSAEIRRKALSERLVIAHTRELYTTYAYNRQSWSRRLQSGTNVSYDAAVRYSPSASLEAALGAGGQSFTTNFGGGLSRFRLEPSGRFTLDLPQKVRFSANTSVGIESVSRSLPSGAVVDVLEERHEIDVSRRFELEQLRVEAASIEIWDEARTLLLVENIDYRILQTGPVTAVQVLPGARVAEGEAVLVTYRYVTVASTEADVLYVNYETSLRRGGIVLRHGRRQRNADTSGFGAALAASDDIEFWYGASTRGGTPLGEASLDVTRRIRKSSAIGYRSDDFVGDLTPPRLGRVEARVRMSGSRTTTVEQVTTTASAGASLTWTAGRRTRVTGGLDGWLWDRDDQSSETFLSGHVMVTWQWGQMNTVVSFDQLRRQNGISRTENRWSIRLVRRF